MTMIMTTHIYFYKKEVKGTILETIKSNEDLFFNYK